MIKKSISLKILFPVIIFLYSCNNGQAIFIKPADNKIREVTLADKITIDHEIKNPYNHIIEYTYTTEKGQIIAKNKNDKNPIYYAPFIGGVDTLRTVVFDKTANIEIADISENFYIKGQSISYVELSNPSNNLGDKENGKIKIASIIGTTLKKEIGLGRNPTISDNGKYIAYVKYSENGSSQIIMQDLSGKEINLTNDDSVNKDPSWSPIDIFGNIYLVFSSNRNIDNSNPDRKFHLWKINISTKELTQLTKDNSNDVQPDWSPDNKYIVFSSNLNKNIENNTCNLYLLGLDTGTRRQITYEDVSGYGTSNPVWSYDSQKIIYTRNYKKRVLQQISDIQKIWMIDFTRISEGFGQSITMEYDSSRTESFPSWSPDGRGFTFVLTRGTENLVQSIDFSSLSGTRIASNELPVYEKDLTNITEIKWARQRINNSYEDYLLRTYHIDK